VTSEVSLVLIAFIGIVVPVTTTILNFLQNRAATRRVEAVRTDLKSSTSAAVDAVRRADEKLDTIHNLVNSQLTDAVNRFKDALGVIEELKELLVRLAPNDPRVAEMLKQSQSQASTPKKAESGP
jgi:hypothetical protein